MRSNRFLCYSVLVIRFPQETQDQIIVLFRGGGGFQALSLHAPEKLDQDQKTMNIQAWQWWPKIGCGHWSGLFSANFAFFWALNFKCRSLKFGNNRSFCGISGISMEISASGKYFRTQEMAIPYATNPYPH